MPLKTYSADLAPHMASKILSLPSEKRLPYLRDVVTSRFSKANPCPEGGSIRGLQLNITLLRTLGASPWLIRNLKNGIQLPLCRHHVGQWRNHPSLLQHLEAAEEEWSRLDKLGEVRWWASDRKPESLNVNPCAVLLKEEQGSDGSWRT